MLNPCVEVFFIFPDNDQVHTRVRRGDGGRVGFARSDVSVEVQGFANGYIHTFIAFALRGGNGAFQEYFLNFAFPGPDFTPDSVNGIEFAFPTVSALSQPSGVTDQCSKADCGEQKVCSCTHSKELIHNIERTSMEMDADARHRSCVRTDSGGIGVEV